MSERRYWIWALIVLAIGVALRWRSFLVGFGMDDFAQLAMLGDAYPVHREPWDLFSFSRGTPEEVHALMSRGSLAWWSWPELKLSAMRPLSSLLRGQLPGCRVVSQIGGCADEPVGRCRFVPALGEWCDRDPGSRVLAGVAGVDVGVVAQRADLARRRIDHQQPCPVIDQDSGESG